MARNSMPYDFPEILHYNNNWFLCKRDGSLDEGGEGIVDGEAGGAVDGLTDG